MGKTVYKIGDYELVWEFGKDENNISKQPINNLYIDNVWNMLETVGSDEVCTWVRIVEPDRFVFSTFRGINYEMQVEGESVVFVSKEIVK